MSEFLEGYYKEQKTIDLTKVSKLTLYFNIAWILLFAIPYFIIWKEHLSRAYIKNILPDLGTLSILVYGIGLPLVMIVLIVLHELIHGFFFGLFAQNGYKSVSFGVLLKHLTPYCHCSEPLLLKHYMIAAVMPGILLGLIPSILGVTLGNLLWLSIGWFMTMGAMGDMMIIQLLWNEDKQSDFVLDHPSEAGCYIFRNKKLKE